VPVLTEFFHMLDPDSVGAERLREFIMDRSDFATCRISRGHRLYPFEVIPSS
jgi:hypothetical protein